MGKERGFKWSNGRRKKENGEGRRRRAAALFFRKNLLEATQFLSSFQRGKDGLPAQPLKVGARQLCPRLWRQPADCIIDRTVGGQSSGVVFWRARLSTDADSARRERTRPKLESDFSEASREVGEALFALVIDAVDVQADEILERLLRLTVSRRRVEADRACE